MSDSEIDGDIRRLDRLWSLYFSFPAQDDLPSDDWGYVANYGYAKFPSTPTRRKVFALCLAVGIDLMEKS